ncbi:protein of unknown function [Cyanobium sp. NIES-981]|nr:protein of unknown function [Cyanobium sp. NIES-981]
MVYQRTRIHIFLISLLLFLVSRVTISKTSEIWRLCRKSFKSASLRSCFTWRHSLWYVEVIEIHWELGQRMSREVSIS